MARLIAVGVQCAAFALLTSLYLAGAANPQPGPPPAPAVLRPATPVEDAQWQRQRLADVLDEARRAAQ